ncbi:MAG TPA: DUF1080 domain-containing protein [Verrucomicrobiae bacterium]|jgi:hypothetical protein
MKWFTLLSLTLAFAVFAADDKPTFTDPAAAGQDYVDQGEYKNDWGGAQIIALGDDKFRMVTYRGGLPGDGWDKEFKQEINGKRDGGKVVFTSTNNYRAELAAGKITINSDAGGPWTMEKTERKSPTMGAKPPAGAVVLFDGTNGDEWKNAHIDTERHLLQPPTTSKKVFTNFTMHIEFLLPFKPLGRGQDRGNSGVYLLDRYECQVLDSFGLKGENNECGGFYQQAKPAVNMCYPPLTWQTYDFDVTAAKWDEAGKKVSDTVVTVKHNGVVIHDQLQLKKETPGGGMKEVPQGGGIHLQGHGNPVFYRNIWIVPKG